MSDINSCQDLCDANLTCAGIDWLPERNKSCGLLTKNMKADSENIENVQFTHYTIDRSVKTIANCIGLSK